MPKLSPENALKRMYLGQILEFASVGRHGEVGHLIVALTKRYPEDTSLPTILKPALDWLKKKDWWLYEKTLTDCVKFSPAFQNTESYVVERDAIRKQREASNRKLKVKTDEVDATLEKYFSNAKRDDRGLIIPVAGNFVDMFINSCKSKALSGKGFESILLLDGIFPLVQRKRHKDLIGALNDIALHFSSSGSEDTTIAMQALQMASKRVLQSDLSMRAQIASTALKVSEAAAREGKLSISVQSDLIAIADSEIKSALSRTARDKFVADIAQLHEINPAKAIRLAAEAAKPRYKMEEHPFQGRAAQIHEHFLDARDRIADRAKSTTPQSFPEKFDVRALKAA